MTHYTITKECLATEYHGAGKAWAAVRDGQVVALRYMGDHPIPGHGDYTVPDWIRGILDAAEGLDDHFLPITHSSKGLTKLASAASACDDCPVPPRRERYRPSELLTMARAALATLDSASFARYRQRCRDELAKLGDLISGTCSCTKFCDF